MPRKPNDPIEETNATGFEIRTCDRCGGSGRYSFNLMHGSVCYGCGGSGKVFTKRGQAARKRMIESRMKPISSIEVGHYVRLDTGRGKMRKVVAITPPDAANGTINGEPVGLLYDGKTNLGFVGDTPVESCRDAAEVNATIAAAVEYQKTLPWRDRLPK